MKKKDIKADGKTVYAIGAPTQDHYVTTNAYVIGFGWKKNRYRDLSTGSYFTQNGKSAAIAVEVCDWDSEVEGATKWEPRVVPLSHVLRTWKEQKARERQHEKDSRAASRLRDKKQKEQEAQAERIKKKFAQLRIEDEAPSVFSDRAIYFTIGDLEKLLDRLVAAEGKPDG